MYPTHLNLNLPCVTAYTLSQLAMCCSSILLLLNTHKVKIWPAAPKYEGLNPLFIPINFNQLDLVTQVIFQKENSFPVINMLS
jgi:hypothetical protein